VLPALIRKAHEAKLNGDGVLSVWGTGTPRREFLHVDDLAAATAFVLEREVPDGLLNVGVGEDLSIREIAQQVAQAVGFDGEIVFDPSRPDGTPRKLLDVSRLTRLGWRAQIGLQEGIEATYQDFITRFGAATLSEGTV
jgi:GDP-L-fucose synthase